MKYRVYWHSFGKLEKTKFVYSCFEIDRVDLILFLKKNFPSEKYSQFKMWRIGRYGDHSIIAYRVTNVKQGHNKILKCLLIEENKNGEEARAIIKRLFETREFN